MLTTLKTNIVKSATEAVRIIGTLATSTAEPTVWPASNSRKYMVKWAVTQKGLAICANVTHTINAVDGLRRDCKALTKNHFSQCLKK
jgi:hypothetical protein